MNITSILGLLSFLLLGCKGDSRDYKEIYNRETGLTERIEYFPSGAVRAKSFFQGGKKHGEVFENYENGNLEAKLTYVNGILDGISKLYYPNGELKRVTYFSKGLPVGWSYEYWENGEKKMSREFVEFEEDSKLNQYIIFNKAGVALRDSSHYMRLVSIDDTVSLGEELTFRFKLEAPFYGSKSQVRLEVGGFDDQYRLVNPAMTDTIPGDGLSAEYTVQPTKRGMCVIRGRLEDYKVEPFSAEEIMKRYNIKAENPDEIGQVTESLYIYFTKEFYVK